MAINPSDTVSLNVSGSNFVTRRATLYRLPNSRLHLLTTREHDVTFFFDRDPEIFRFVLDFYRTGELHLPSNVCGPFARKELIFWGISESDIQPCCLPNYMRYEEERRTKNTLFRDCFEDIEPMQSLIQVSRGWRRFRYKMWLFLDYPTSSLAAKIWAMLLLMLMIASVMCYCLTTHASFRLPSDKAQLYNTSFVCSEALVAENPKLERDCQTVPVPYLVIVDIALNLVFTIEFLSKLLVCPDKAKYLKSIVSVLDIVIIFSYWAYMALFYHYYYQASPEDFLDREPNISLWVLNILAMSQALRILRIFKISKISRGLRVLMLTIKKSSPELVLLAFLLMNGMFLFSSMIYMAEYRVGDTFPDIPQSFWWTIVTLTTVGYGDMCPKGLGGYLIGSLTAICGCVLTGLAIPIIGNNFNTYYMYMKNQLKESKYLKQMSKDLSSSMTSYGKGTNKKYLQLRGDLQADTQEKLRLMNGIVGRRKPQTPSSPTPGCDAKSGGTSGSVSTPPPPPPANPAKSSSSGPPATSTNNNTNSSSSRSPLAAATPTAATAGSPPGKDGVFL